MSWRWSYLAIALFLTVTCKTPEPRIPTKNLRVFEEFRAESYALNAIQDRSRLRAITYFNSMNYFIAEGSEMGFEYNLAHEFADWLGVELEIVVPPSISSIYDWLSDAGGDLIILPHDLQMPLPSKLTYSAPYSTTFDVILMRRDKPIILNAAELQDITIYTIRKSQQHSVLSKLAEKSKLNLKVKQIAEDHSDDELLELLADGKIEAIALDGHFAEVAINSKYKQFKVVYRLTEERPVGWVLPADSEKLKQRLDQFLALHYHIGDDGQPKRSAFYNVNYRNYYDNPSLPRWHKYEDDATGTEEGNRQVAAVSRFDPLIRDIGAEYGIDWRLLLAVIYAESRFKPNATSFAGAKGLMQLLPDTFESLGFVKIYDTEENIRAGAAYLKTLYRTYANSDLNEDQKLRFIIASYNAGIGHVEDARKLAAEMGWKDNSWHGGIKEALKLLSDERYYSKVPHGYCRGDETTAYVDKVIDHYSLFKKFFPA